uniref:Uncharacterized protein n=1 Tax=Sphaerodactylus townsendi TaxID=933632 RepID=A0ACB8G7X0_9SAUR
MHHCQLAQTLEQNMKSQLNEKEKEQVAEPPLSVLEARQPTGYSSASFYDLTSLPSLTESTSDPDFEYSSPSEPTSSSDNASPAHSEHSSASLSLASDISWAGTAQPSAGSGSHSERQSSAESGPSFPEPSWAASENTTPFGHSLGLEGWSVDSDSSGLSYGGENGVAWPTSLIPSVMASPQNGHSPIVVSPTSSLASGPSEQPQRCDHPGHRSRLSSEGESDHEGPVRFVVYSPHKTLKDLRGDCGCWQEKKKLRWKSLKAYT